MKFLQGKKTYILAVTMVIQSLINLLGGDMTVLEFMQSPHLNTLMEGLGFAALRAGIAKNIKLY